MLKQRVVTAVILLLVLLPAMFYPSPWPFCVVAGVLICAAAWEWARLNGCGSLRTGISVFICAVLCLVIGWKGLLEQTQLFRMVWIPVGAVWVLGGAWLLGSGVARWARINPMFRSVLGILLLVMAWVAVSQARVIGVNFLLSILALVWVADIFAYFAGRSLGGRFTSQKLAPSISPGKSWEGVWGGMAGVVVLAVGWHRTDLAWAADSISIFSQFALRGWWFLVFAVLFLAAMSVVGDLLESLVKRSAGVKDSSGLLPGHGGVLDRLDALLPVVPLAMMLYTA